MRRFVELLDEAPIEAGEYAVKLARRGHDAHEIISLIPPKSKVLREDVARGILSEDQPWEEGEQLFDALITAGLDINGFIEDYIWDAGAHEDDYATLLG